MPDVCIKCVIFVEIMRDFQVTWEIFEEKMCDFWDKSKIFEEKMLRFGLHGGFPKRNCIFFQVK